MAWGLVLSTPVPLDGCRVLRFGVTTLSLERAVRSRWRLHRKIPRGRFLENEVSLDGVRFSGFEVITYLRSGRSDPGGNNGNRFLTLELHENEGRHDYLQRFLELSRKMETSGKFL